METMLPYLRNHSDIAAAIGLLIAALLTGLAVAPAAWFVAALIFMVLTMPAFLLIRPVVLFFRDREAFLAP